MSQRSLRRDVLQTLATSKEGLTHKQLVAALRPNQRLTFQEDVERNAAISRVLQTLKAEHRAWPTDSVGLRRWNITSRGRRSH